MQNDSWYQKRGVTPPSSVSHGITVEDISKTLEPVNPRNWRLEGNKLIADTDMGELVNYINTDYILTGTDKNGRPILTKIEL